ncbi:MAG: DUF3418 domain-containing protein, partial [Porticoccaceae bacterium]|nr:DUF3418 domain-containing protein [Porticoccaceae bacterium]
RWQAHYKNRYRSSIADAKQQLAYLLRPGFLFETDAFWLQQYPRYCKALALRLEKLPAQEGKDEAFCREMAEYIESWRQLSALPGGVAKKYRQDLEKFRYLLEEYRVSTFAQVLKTVQAVSAKRLTAFILELKGKIAGS